MAESDERYWKIVGGADKGGIIVRSGREVSSAQAAQRVATGAVVLEKDRVGDRIEYGLVSGDGPMVGWISLNFKGAELAVPCEKPNPLAVLDCLEALRDPGWSGELEVQEIEVGGLKAVVRRRPEGAPKAPVSVLMLPGNPVVNSYSADMPLPSTMDVGFGKAGFPVVRFDWNGVGMNKFTGNPLHQEYHDKLPLAYMMFEVAKHLGQRVVLCSWNYSGTVVTTEQCTSEPGKMFIETLPEVCAVISLSFAYKQWEFVKRFVNEEAGLHLKYEFEQHSRITVPALYIFGDRDVHTPEEDVRKIVEARPDGGEGAEIYVVSQKDQKLISTFYFMLKDKETEAAGKAAAWLSKLRAELVTVDSPLAGA